jgi:DNA polymerase-3 subunit alpha
MEECKRMGLMVLGPDINESQNGFAVNKKGEIRFGFSGLKGVGENAIENIIEERDKLGFFKDIFDLVKRVNLRSVSKKSLESLIYSGAFDCFKDFHRAQYFFTPPGDIISLEKIVKFGAVYQSNSASTSNTLFGDLQMPDIVPPKLPLCPPWQLIEQLDFEKEVTGMYMSGHPLDNFKFEMNHYNLTPISDFLEVKNAIGSTPSTRSFRLAGLVVDAQHRLTKTGKNYGVLFIEDYSGKTDFFLWQEDYVKYLNYLEKGMIIMVEGSFKEKRFRQGEYEFSFAKLHLLETVKSTLTKQVIIDIEPAFVDDSFIHFIEQNIKDHPGKTSIKVNITDNLKNHSVSMYTIENGFTMNDDMAVFLNESKDFNVSVLSA